MEKADDFFKALYQRCKQGQVELRFISAVKTPQDPVVTKFIPLSGFTLPSCPDNKNVYFGVATRDGKAGTKANLVEIPALWADLDLKQTPREAILEKFKGFPLKPSLAVETGGGYHVYWLLSTPATKDETANIENYLDRIAFHLGSDPSATDASRVLRIPGTLNIKYDPPRKVIIKKLDPSLVYNLSDFDFLPEIPREKPSSGGSLSPRWQDELLQGVPEGERNATATQLAGRWFAMRHSEKEVLVFLSAWNQRNAPPLSEKELEAIVRSVEATNRRNHQGQVNISSDQVISLWPPPLAPQAFYGLAGEIVRTIEPQTESDPMALLIQCLTATGNVIGSNAYFQVEADKHNLKIFSVLVGETSKGRKGTSWGHIKKIFSGVDPTWAEKRIMGGLSSGEGLLWAVRDEITKKEPVRDKGRITGEYQEVVVDQGEADKRLLIIEPEFASTLRVIGRDGNTLSPIIRQAWDDGNLRILTKNTPARSTGAHISTIGHITKDELRRYLDRTETGNGFANRFIWLCVKRSKALPEGGRVNDSDLTPIIGRLREVVDFGKNTGEIARDAAATAIWASIYPGLSEGKPGLFGAVTSRSEAQVMRLACVYALLDRSLYVRREHLLAALAIWDYAEASARYIFGNSTGNPIAERILASLKQSPSGLSLSEIHDLFSRHEGKAKIQAALNLLENFCGVQKGIRDTRGRPSEVWQIGARNAK